MSDAKKQVAEQIQEDVPPDVPKTPSHELACSFCNAPKARVEQLVACPRASICDACIRRHRPRGLLVKLRAWLVGRPRARGEVVAMPYRTIPAGCSFCQTPNVATIGGAYARICDPCLDLARDVLPRT